MLVGRSRLNGKYNMNRVSETKALDQLCCFRNIESGYRLLVEITSRCNRNCLHCFYNDRQADLPVTFWLDLLNKISNTGLLIKKILITGGEPLLHDGIMDILIFANSKNWDIDINTNGDFISDEMLDALCEITNLEISISLTCDEHFNNYLTQTDSYQDTKSTIRKLIKKGITVDVHSICSSSNWMYFNDFADELYNYGVDTLTLLDYLPNTPNLGEKIYKISNRDRQLLFSWLEAYRKSNKMAIRTRGFRISKEEYGCDVLNKSIISVNSRGYLSNCLQASYEKDEKSELLNLIKVNFKEAFSLLNSSTMNKKRFCYRSLLK